MYKIVLFMLFIVFYMIMFALQTDEEVALHTLFRVKHAVNYAVHAASQQLDQAQLAQGVVSIDINTAKLTALHYLQSNLSLDADNNPLQGSFFQSRIEVLVFQTFNANLTYPYTYRNDAYDYEVTLNKPGVVMIIKVNYPRMYNVIGPIVWEVKGASETTNNF